MHIFVTGSSGFVGGAATKALVSAGHTVAAMSRSTKSDGLIQALGAAPVRCNLQTVTAEHMQDADAVLHCAAFVEPWGPKNAWYEANVLGTLAVLDAARSASVKRFIHIGTEAAICHGQDLFGANEKVPLAFDSPYPYCATKAQAEQIVIDANGDDFETIILRPRFIWGPGDTTLLPILEAMARSGKWMWVDNGSAMTSTTHIDNLVHAILLSLTKGQSGEAYFILDDGTISLKDMITGMTKSLGLTLADKSIPRGLADFFGRWSEIIWRGFNLRNQPPLTAHAAMVMSRNCTLNGKKATTQLGFRPVISRDDGLAKL